MPQRAKKSVSARRTALRLRGADGRQAYRDRRRRSRQRFRLQRAVQFSFRQAGVILPRSAGGAADRRLRAFACRICDTAPAFSTFQGKRNSHVGIYVGDGQFVTPRPPASSLCARIGSTRPYWRKQPVGGAAVSTPLRRLGYSGPARRSIRRSIFVVVRRWAMVAVRAAENCGMSTS